MCDTDLWLGHNSSHTWPGLYGTSVGSHSLCGGDDDGDPLSCCWSMSRGGHGPALSLSPPSISLSSLPLSPSQHVSSFTHQSVNAPEGVRWSPSSLDLKPTHPDREEGKGVLKSSSSQEKNPHSQEGFFFFQLKKHSSKLILILNMLLFLCLSVFPLFSFWCWALCLCELPGQMTH